MLKNNVGVVIPFYQREQGILAKALISIVNQRVNEIFFTMVIVDDESPIPAESEIALVPLPDNCRIELIKQSNAGPAAARNSALDYLQTCNISIVAFLDSDDIWAETHIAEALSALNDGAGFYFCDHSRFVNEHSWFDELESLKNWHKTCADFDIDVHANTTLATLSGANCFRLFLQDYLSQTSCIVYDFSAQSTARFDPSLVSAGEDFFLWLQLVNNCEKVTFSFSKNVHCGEGVNIYFDSFDWDKLASSTKEGCHTILYKMILSTFKLQQSDYELIKVRSEVHFNRYSFLVIKHVIKGIGFNRDLVNIMFKKFPLAMLSIPFRFVLVTLNKRILDI